MSSFFSSTLQFARITLEDIFYASFGFYLVSQVIERIKPGVITNLFEPNIFMFSSVVAAFIILLIGRNREKKKYKRFLILERGLLSILVITLSILVIYEEVRPAKQYVLTPESQSVLTKRNNSPLNASEISYENKSYWLINSEPGSFEVSLDDIYEKITMVVNYRATTAETLTIRSEREKTLPQINSNRISVYEELSRPEWVWEPQQIENEEQLALYVKPGLPTDFPSLDTFLEENTYERVITEPKLFIVKNDQNIDYLPIIDDLDLPFIAYVIAPTQETLEPLLIDAPLRNTNAIFQRELSEKLHESHRSRGSKYAFDIELETTNQKEWALIESIEIQLERTPISFDSVTNFFNRFLSN